MKSLFMPYRCQTIGWWLFAAIFVMFGLTLLLFNVAKVIPQDYSRYATLLLYTLGWASLFLICLSKEKYEDELIIRVRLDAVALSAYILFGSYIIIQMIYTYTSILKLGDTLFILKTEYLIFNPLAIIVIYLIILRTKLFILKRAAKNEE